MTDMPVWLQKWIQKDRLLGNKYKLSRKYLRNKKRIHFVEGNKEEDGSWKSFHYEVYSHKYGKYNVYYHKEQKPQYKCNCPFFKHRLLCSHILGVCQKTEVYPTKASIFDILFA